MIKKIIQQRNKSKNSSKNKNNKNSSKISFFQKLLVDINKNQKNIKIAKFERKCIMF